PVVGVLGVFDDVGRATPSGWRDEGQLLYLIGATRDELDGSQWAAMHGHLGGLPPQVDLEVERELAQIMVSCSRDGLVDAARSLSEGGLVAALAQGVFRYGVGARVVLDEVCQRDGISPAQALL